jgi:streptomycin 6-kinase
MNEERQPVRIWVYRTGTGCLRVFPSPVNVAHGDTLLFKNRTESAMTVHFNLRGTPDSPKLTRIAAGGMADLTLPEAGDPLYHEYGVEVHSDRGPEHAEGGSRPSVIIDP